MDLDQQENNDYKKNVKSRLATIILRSLGLRKELRDVVENNINVVDNPEHNDHDVSVALKEIAQQLNVDASVVSKQLSDALSQRERVIIESPYAGDVEFNMQYARACMSDSIKRGEAPIAFHTLYTQPGVLDDNVIQERSLGLSLSDEWRTTAHKTVVYTDLGISSGMKDAIEHATVLRQTIEYRELGWKK